MRDHFLHCLQGLLPELRARLQRDTHLRYALRELEMQRALMGKGASRKIRGPELIKLDGEDDELNEDEQDALFGKRRKAPQKR
jgi:U3 small nucleolar RNA-associated protein 11